MYRTNCYISFYLQCEHLLGKVILSFRNESTEVTDSMLNLHRINLQRKHLSILAKRLSAAAQAGAVFYVKRSSPESFLFSSTASVLTYGPCKVETARRVFFTSPWKQRRIVNGPFSPWRLFIPTWEPSTTNQKELQGQRPCRLSPAGNNPKLQPPMTF